MGINILGSYSPTSQHIFVGKAQHRIITQTGFGYSHNIKRWSNLGLSYEGTLEPFYQESDPTILGTSTANVFGPPSISIFPEPFRPIGFPNYFGVEVEGSSSIPINPIPGHHESTYAFAALPIGVRVSAFTRTRIQPTFALNLGALYATRNIPIDYSSSFNFLTCIGPGVEIFADRHSSIRLEYLYDHMSNANLGYANPGVDSGTFRVTLSRYK